MELNFASGLSDGQAMHSVQAVEGDSLWERLIRNVRFFSSFPGTWRRASMIKMFQSRGRKKDDQVSSVSKKPYIPIINAISYYQTDFTPPSVPNCPNIRSYDVRNNQHAKIWCQSKQPDSYTKNIMVVIKLQRHVVNQEFGKTLAFKWIKINIHIANLHCGLPSAVRHLSLGVQKQEMSKTQIASCELLQEMHCTMDL